MSHWQENDTTAQEATPEELRIAIDDAFRNFLYSDQTEFTFSSDLNNLQRKYIHEKAQLMNLKSRSHGKEPNRKLTIYKKQSLTNLNDTCQLKLSVESAAAITRLVENCRLEDLERPYRRKVPCEKVFGRIFSSPPVEVPPANVPRDIERFKKSLPITPMRETILSLIQTNQIMIISSETGSGKTTQIPQLIMEDCNRNNRVCRVICTQPRRISTVAVAERVARERGDYLGHSVGYHIRLESKLSVRTNLIYCTNGVLIRSLMSLDSLSQITHVIIDEVHERDRLSDFLLICLKKSLPQNPHLKLILMSATVNIEKFKEYFCNAEVLQVPGRLHYVDEYFLDDILQKTEYMSPKMQQICSGEADDSSAVIDKKEKLAEMDTALNDCLRNNTADAWGQLMLYICGENLPVNYQHSQTGLTALMVAAINNNIENMCLLQAYNADITIKCFRDRTALDWAKMHGHLDAIEQLNRQYITQTPREKLLECYIKSVTDDLIDFDLLTHVITYIHKNEEPGAILVFLAGYDDIMILSEQIADALQDYPHTYQIYHLHGGMNISDQHSVFTILPNKRKIILATNIAETSITIDDVKFVVDSGKAKEKTFDSYTGLCALQMNWISKACVKQRTGRAGRTSNGCCYRIFSRQRYNHFQEERTPEILRVPLEPLCLNTKVIAPNEPLTDFFELAPDPPSKNLVKAAIQSLIALGAMDENENLTALGEYLGQLTIDPHLGKMLIYSVIFRCVDPVLTLVSIMTQKDPFLLPSNMRHKAEATAKRKSLNYGIPSDHVIYLKAFQIWQDVSAHQMEKEFLKEFFISKSTMDSALMIRNLLLGQLRAAGFILPRGPQSMHDMNTNANNWAVVKAVIASGLYPRIAYMKGSHLRTRCEKSVSLSTQSCVSNMTPNRKLWYMYEELIKARGSPAIRCVTLVTPITIALICGNYSDSQETGSITIDDWLAFSIPNHGVLFLRKSLELVIQKILTTSEHSLQPQERDIINTVVTVLLAEDRAAGLQQPPHIGDRPRFMDKSSMAKLKKQSRRQIPVEPDVFSMADQMTYDYLTSERLTNKPNGFENTNNYGRSFNRKVKDHGGPVRSSIKSPPMDPTSVNANTYRLFDSSEDFSQNGAESMLYNRPGPGLNPTGLLNNIDPNTLGNVVASNGVNIPSFGKRVTSAALNNQRMELQSFPNGLEPPLLNDFSLSLSNCVDTAPLNNQPLNIGLGFTNIDAPHLTTQALGFGNITATGLKPGLILSELTNGYNSVPLSAVDIDQLSSTDSIRLMRALELCGDPELEAAAPSSGAVSCSSVPNMNEIKDKVDLLNGCSSNSASPPYIDPNILPSSDDTVYLLIKPKQQYSVQISYESSKWIFSPQTERKILTLVNQQKKVRLVYMVTESNVICGIAEFVGMAQHTIKPEALIKWLVKIEVSYHLVGCYPVDDMSDGGATNGVTELIANLGNDKFCRFCKSSQVFEAPDGNEIDRKFGDTLCSRIISLLNICEAIGQVRLT